MNQQELEKKLGYTMNDWEWKKALFVRTYSPEVKTDEAWIKLLSLSNGYTMKFYPNYAVDALLEKALEVAKSKGFKDYEARVDKLSTYDVLFGLCINMKGRPCEEIFKELRYHLQILGLEPDEYFMLEEEFEKQPFPNYHWIACYAVPGGSEGHFIHVDIIGTKGRKLFACGKTLQETKAGLAYCYRIAAAISEYFYY